jgi:hypothetical protein
MDNTTIAMLLVMSLPQGWAELLDVILDPIIQRLSCTSGLFTFIATCPLGMQSSWKPEPQTTSFSHLY